MVIDQCAGVLECMALGVLYKATCSRNTFVNSFEPAFPLWLQAVLFGLGYFLCAVVGIICLRWGSKVCHVLVAGGMVCRGVAVTRAPELGLAGAGGVAGECQVRSDARIAVVVWEGVSISPIRCRPMIRAWLVQRFVRGGWR